MEFPVIISFYTKKTPYEREIERLIASCNHFELSHSIEGIESLGSWELNCACKPFFILKKLDELQKPILWVDADRVFVEKPTWQKAFDAELAVRINEELEEEHPSKVISSTIFVRPSEKGKFLIKDWIKHCALTLLDKERKEEFWDQIALRDVLLKNRDSVKSMPVEYSKIFDHPGDCQRVHKPVIEHFQASRRFKKLV